LGYEPPRPTRRQVKAVWVNGRPGITIEDVIQVAKSEAGHIGLGGFLRTFAVSFLSCPRGDGYVVLVEGDKKGGGSFRASGCARGGMRN
jgi:hypothetical protein